MWSNFSFVFDTLHLASNLEPAINSLQTPFKRFAKYHTDYRLLGTKTTDLMTIFLFLFLIQIGCHYYGRMKFVSLIAAFSLVVAVMGNPIAQNEVGAEESEMETTVPTTAGEESGYL